MNRLHSQLADPAPLDPTIQNTMWYPPGGVEMGVLLQYRREGGGAGRKMVTRTHTIANSLPVGETTPFEPPPPPHVVQCNVPPMPCPPLHHFSTPLAFLQKKCSAAMPRELTMLSTMHTTPARTASAIPTVPPTTPLRKYHCSMVRGPLKP